jgi:dolichyl-phosphate-mannose--protein O-mannosyl transferase
VLIFSFFSQQFTRWGDNDHRVYLLGNPIIFWGNLVCFALLAAAGIIYAALRQRGILVRCGRRNRGLSRPPSQVFTMRSLTVVLHFPLFSAAAFG